MNYYKQAIEIIGGEHDWYQIAVNIAKKNPKALVDAVYKSGWRSEAKEDAVYKSGWRSEAKELVADGKKIDAIKLCRNSTGWSLLKAKEAVEEL